MHQNESPNYLDVRWKMSMFAHQPRHGLLRRLFIYYLAGGYNIKERFLFVGGENQQMGCHRCQTCSG